MKSFIKYTILILSITVLQFSLHAQDTLNLAQIEESIEKYMKYFSDENPGAVVTLIKKGESKFNKAYGMSDVPQKEKMNTNKAFNLGELSKAFTAAAILKLVEKKKVSLNDNLRKIFPDLPAYASNITISHILEHKSGLPKYKEEEVNSNEDVYNFLLKQTDTSIEPGSKMFYSNSDYILLAMIIEKASGMSYQDYLRKNIFNKLKMNNTFFSNEIEGKNIAMPHFKENGEYIVKNKINSIYGSQGIYSTSEDLIKWDKALYSDKLLKCENLSKIFRIGKLTEGENKSDYTFGWVLMAKNGIRYFWQGGSQGGYSNLILHLPDTQTTVLILSNRNDGYDFLKMSIYIAKLFDKNLKL